MARKKKQEIKRKQAIKNQGTAMTQPKGRNVAMAISLSITGAVLLAILLLAASYLFLYPEIKVRVQTQPAIDLGLIAHTVIISNHSSQNISSLSFGFRFGEKYPVGKLAVRDTMYKSGITVKIHEDMMISEVTLTPNDNTGYVRYRSGFSGQTDKFIPGAEVVIDVIQDQKYSGEMGDVFPPLAPACLRPNSYCVEYKYNPLGILSPFFLSTGPLCYDFAGKRVKADYYKAYTQKVQLPGGEIFPITIDWPSKKK